MAYLPPVNIPSLGGKNYARELHGMIAGVGEAYYGTQRDNIADDQWAAEQERLNTAQALAQSNADRNYALELRRFESSDELARRKFEADQAAVASGAGEYGLNGVWGYNEAEGRWGYFQPNKAGGAASQVQFPDGFNPMPPTSNANLGTSIQPVSTRGGVPIGPGMGVDVAGTATQTATGKATGEAQAALPVIEQNADFVLRTIEDALTDPDLGSVTGPIQGMLPAWSWSGGKERAQSRLDQINGQTFLLAYDKIRGAGQITEYESQRASAALNRLQTQRMSDADYVATLREFRQEVLKLVELARQRAGRGGQQMSPGGLQVFEEQ